MSQPFVPADFEVPLTYEGPGFHLEPLGPVHNERDHAAWMPSIDHIKSTPGMDWTSWPIPMSVEDNMKDMELFAGEFANRESFVYSILDGDTVIGCVYIERQAEGYKDDDYDAVARSWVAESRSEMDSIVWEALNAWLASDWPFDKFYYASRA
ncbi:MAG: N-acetyltransferase [Actinomycetota bacterium]